MMQRKATLAMLTRAVLPSWPTLTEVSRRRAERDVMAYVERQISRMPTFLRVPYEAVLLVFGVGSVLRYGRVFAALPRARQHGWIDSWAGSRIIPVRDFIKMLRSCALLAWFDHPLVAQALAAEASSVSGR